MQDRASLPAQSAGGAGRRSSRGVGARGFSFTELLFAVMIMGIGFIMIAAIFPASLNQTKSNYDESVSASAARAAVASLSRIALKEQLPPTVAPFYVTPLQRVTGAGKQVAEAVEKNMISPADPRYAWVGFYHRPNDVALAQVFVFLLNRSDPFTLTDFAVTPNTPAGYTANSKLLEPRRVEVDCLPEYIELRPFTTGARADEQSNIFAAAPGAFVLVSNPGLAARPADAPRFIGGVYRLGDRLPNGPGGEMRFEYMPGNAFVAETGTFVTPEAAVSQLNNATAYIIGRNRTGLAGVEGDFTGNAMDVAYYTTFISLK
jgi:type II secretory pathway pseudopilin PulG